VGKGDRVAIAMRNYPEWSYAFFAVTAIGAIAVPLNAFWTGPELAFGITDSGSRVVIADGERLERLAPLAADLGDVVLVGTHLADRPGHGPLPEGVRDLAPLLVGPALRPDVVLDPEDAATIFYTSGTTGFPKGAQLTHRGSVDNLFNLVAMTVTAGAAEQKGIAAGDIPAPPPPSPDAPAQTAFMAPTPLFHVTACNCVMHPATFTGSKLVLMYKWDAGRALELIERERVTTFSGVPTMSREMLLHPDWSKRDTSSIQGMGGGGAALQPDLVEKIASAVKGTAPSTGYGMTETCGLITANSGRYFVQKSSSCGTVVPTLEAKLVDEDGNDLTPGPDTVGVLCVRGSVVIKGYLNRPEATADAIRNGWLNTGDIARIDDDGFVYIVDRAKDMVNRGGENVFCSEVETAIYHHDAVAEACVFGVPDDRLGEDVAAAIVLRPGSTLTQEELAHFLSASIAKHKIPSKVWFRTEPLPRNASGKFLKRELRKELTGS